MPENIQENRFVEDPGIEYLAGFFDGEGCVSIARIRRSRINPNHNDVYNVALSVSQVDQEILECYQRRWGGPIYSQAPSRNITAKRQLYVWKPSTTSIKRFLEEVIPYLRVKREQAELALFLLQQGYGKRKLLGEDVRQKVHVLNGGHANFKS